MIKCFLLMLFIYFYGINNNINAATLYLELSSDGTSWNANGNLSSDVQFYSRIYIPGTKNLFNGLNATINGIPTSQTYADDKYYWNATKTLGPISPGNNPFSIIMTNGGNTGTRITGTIDCLFSCAYSGIISPQSSDFIAFGGANLHLDLDVDISRATKAGIYNCQVTDSGVVITSFTVTVNDDSTFSCGSLAINSSDINKILLETTSQSYEEKLHKIDEILIPQDDYEKIINSFPDDTYKEAFNGLKDSGLAYTIYVNDKIGDGSLLRAFASLTFAQLIELMAIGLADDQVAFLKNIAKNLGYLVSKNIYQDSFKYQSRSLVSLLAAPLALKERTWQILNTLNKNQKRIYNNLSVDIRNLLHYNNLALMKFRDFSKQNISQFANMSPVEQLDFVLLNLPITYVRKNMQLIVRHRISFLSKSNQKKNLIFIK